ncbi:hypothetical protein R70723_00630 [Paenibacillus sp. FSL R7-0273]|uniref:hypothetical protein n=1 Tax=Paenibacillus sp. FSL R7-0273 TaxID=1536772 RepID=UPI0004F90543|nr:hypothetical protein [Paenibacillus sp. FSL R7-0273]AIQ44592.1 hypothetical protein R70723_00630 [Paenibacillus sp. FSL R7-0273]OMF85071.1 hypothetical protein BK144_28570 [Paenibacillus sp. FSL R7-0273]
MRWWGNARQEEGVKSLNQLNLDEDWRVFHEVRNAQMEWERAHLMFDEALGQDQIDYAIFILEAAERKYQIHLKHAKSLGLDRTRM